MGGHPFLRQRLVGPALVGDLTRSHAHALDAIPTFVASSANGLPVDEQPVVGDAITGLQRNSRTGRRGRWLPGAAAAGLIAR